MLYVLSNVQWFALLIGALVFFHELGHFLVAKAFDVEVVRFSLGFGPKVLSFRRGETEYTLSLLPLGGYVKMVGETAEDDAARANTRALANKPLYQRALIVLAGPAANMLLASVVYFCMFVGPHTFGDTRLGIVTEGDPGWQAGLRPGDRIVAVDGQSIDTWDQLRDAIAQRAGAQLALSYERGGARHEASVHTGEREEADAFGTPIKRGMAGISLQYVRPTVAVLDPDSPAAAAGIKTGDCIVRVAGQSTAAWHEVRAAIAAAPSGAPIAIELRRGGDSVKVALTPAAAPAGLTDLSFAVADFAGAAGYTGLISHDVTVAAVDADTPAARAGLQPGDRLVAVMLGSGAPPAGGAAPSAVVRRPIGVWGVDLAAFGVDAHTSMALEVQRGRTVTTVPVELEMHDENDEMKNARRTFVFGARNDPADMDTYTYERPVGVLQAAREATGQVAEDASLIGRGIAKMVRGDLPMANMGGPIMLFVIAEKSAKRGWTSFMRAMAMTSVNLGMLNILPVPVLDGGHLLFFGIEAVTRRPPSVRVREWANMAGLGMLLLLMVLVFRNDVVRFFLGGS